MLNQPHFYKQTFAQCQHHFHQKQRIPQIWYNMRNIWKIKKILKEMR